MGQTVIIDCLFLSRKNLRGRALLAPLAPTPLIIVRFSALAIPAESAIADKKKKKERKIFSLLLKQFPKAVNFIIFKNWIEDEKKNRENKVWIYLCTAVWQNKTKSQWKMDLVINYSSDIIIDNETKYTISNCTMRWNIFWRSISGFVQLSKYETAPCFFSNTLKLSHIYLALWLLVFMR